MNDIVTSNHPAISALVKALNLPENTIEFSITVKAGQPVIVSVVYCNSREIELFTNTFAQFVLKEKNETVS